MLRQSPTRPTTRPGGRKIRLTRADEATHPTTMNPSIALYTHLRARHILATRPDSTGNGTGCQPVKSCGPAPCLCGFSPRTPARTMVLSGYIPKNPAIKVLNFECSPQR